MSLEGLQTCSHCGAELEYEDCWSCGGDGWIDLYEEDPISYSPGELEKCDVCEGEGGYLVCPFLPHKDSEVRSDHD